jgi:hypothetical protein
MLRDFIVTRIVLGIVVVVVAAWTVMSLVDGLTMQEPGPTPISQRLSLPPVLSDSGVPYWEEELLAPEIQEFWRERRLLLAELSEQYRAESDSYRTIALRREIEALIQQSERDVYALRLKNARHAGYGGLADRLEWILDELPVMADEDSCQLILQ